VVQLQLEKADGLALCPRKRDRLARLRVRQRANGVVTLLARIRQIGLKLVFGVDSIGHHAGFQFSQAKGSWRSKSLHGAGEIQVEPEECMIGDVPELGKRWWQDLIWGVAPEALFPQRGRTGHQGVLEHVDRCAELLPQSSLPPCLHVLSS